MFQSILIKNATIINEGQIFVGHVAIANGQIEAILSGNLLPSNFLDYKSIDASNKLLIPGCIDDQVHFREPGLTHKADIYTESKAAIAGGITSYMEMPNTIPQTITLESLQHKFDLAQQKSLANYSFYIGATNHNIDVLLAADIHHTAGIKIFMGSSTGNMLVDNEDSLRQIFSRAKMLVAVHCEDESTIAKNITRFKQTYGDSPPISVHPLIRSDEACYLSSSLAVSLAKQYDTRLHVLHLSTAKELALFDGTTATTQKQITAEVCVHHLWFDNSFYDRLGTHIKWNPAIKTAHDRTALLAGVLSGKIDVIATDHAPHTLTEKTNNYYEAPSGAPLVQHALPAMLELVHQNKISIEKVVQKMCHAPATIFKVQKRGFIRKGYWADLVLIDFNCPNIVSKENILYKCGWSPFESQTFNAKITHTFVNGNLVFENDKFDETHKGQYLIFERD